MARLKSPKPPRLPAPVKQPPIQQNDIDRRRYLERLRAALELERSSFLAHWKELSEYILPRRARFWTFETNRGEKRNQKIIDSTATESAGILQAGMMSGGTNPSRPWFRLTVPDPQLAEMSDVKAWLYEVQQRMETVFLRSNLYTKLPILYLDAGVFGTGAMGVFEDEEQVIRCYDFPVGSYTLGADHRGNIRVFVRLFRLTVQQVVERWGHLDTATGLADFQRGEETMLSIRVQTAWTRGVTQEWVDIVHVVQPNAAYDGVKIEARYKKFESLYYEAGNTSTGFLELAGFDEFPILGVRWETGGEDVYGTNCPGMRALGDIKQLQFMERKVAQAINKQLDPPLKGPPELRNQRVSTLPGDISYSAERDGQQGLTPIYQVQFDIKSAEEKMEQIRDRIKKVFKVDLFLMVAQADRDKTATEVNELSEEKMLALGPTLEQLNDDALDPLIDRVFNIMARRGLIPTPPDELQGQALTVEYISIMAQAQRAVGLASLDRFAGAIGQVSQYIPDVLDRFNADEFVEQYADGTGVPPTLLRSTEEAQQMRDARNQQAAQAQQADNLTKVSGAVRNLGNAPVQGNSALAGIVNSMRAQGTVKAAQTPLPGGQGGGQ